MYTSLMLINLYLSIQKICLQLPLNIGGKLLFFETLTKTFLIYFKYFLYEKNI